MAFNQPASNDKSPRHRTIFSRYTNREKAVDGMPPIRRPHERHQEVHSSDKNESLSVEISKDVDGPEDAWLLP